MTPQEAKDYFQMRLSDTVRYANGKQTRQRQSFEIAVEVLEKQIPKNPMEEQNLMTCPVCGCQEIESIDASGIRQYPYCPCCGQAIDWESDEE